MTAHSMLRQVRDEELAYMMIGRLMADAKWRGDQWASLPIETYTAMDEAGADDDECHVGAILNQALSKLAHIEAERAYGVKL